MQPIVRCTQQYPKYTELQEFLTKIWIDHQRPNQLMLQTVDSQKEDWVTGIGKPTFPGPKWEQQFNVLQPSLQNTIVQDFFTFLDRPVFRARLMCVHSKSVYSMHKDSTQRIHLPISTNDQCFFVFRDPDAVIHIPDDGYVYKADTRRLHTFMNGGKEPRLHLVAIDPS